MFRQESPVILLCSPSLGRVFFLFSFPTLLLVSRKMFLRFFSPFLSDCRLLSFDFFFVFLVSPPSVISFFFSSSPCFFHCFFLSGTLFSVNFPSYLSSFLSPSLFVFFFVFDFLLQGPARLHKASTPQSEKRCSSKPSFHRVTNPVGYPSSYQGAALFVFFRTPLTFPFLFFVMYRVNLARPLSPLSWIAPCTTGCPFLPLALLYPPPPLSHSSRASSHKMLS